LKRTASSGRAAGGVRSVNYASSPLLASKTPPWRSKLVVALIGLGSCVLLARAAYVQLIHAEFYQAQGEKRFAHTLVLHGGRGRILDRNGQLLAISVDAPSIWAIPRELGADPGQRRQLARALGMTPAELERRLADNPNFVWLRRQVDDTVAAQVRALALRGVHQTREHRRRYPEGEAAAHVIGFTDVEQRGREGVELAFESHLRGRNGSRDVIRDRLGRIVEDFGNQINPVHGADIVLSVDAKVQALAFRAVRDAVAEHRAKAASAVVLDARSGEVLALANYPSFDPHQRQRLSGAQLRNRALTDTFEPGSTVKPFIAAWAMETGRATPDSVLDTGPGWMSLTGSTIRDHRPMGRLTLAAAVQRSSNIAFVQLALQMPPREMWQLYRDLGFGQRPQIEFPGPVSGRLRPYRGWRPIEQATMSYGYGLSTSLLQLARSYTVFVDGELLPLTLLRREQPVAGTRVLSSQTAGHARAMLELATDAQGTAPLAQTVGWSVGGKTGTALRLRQDGSGYYRDRFRASFVGIAPVDAPRIIVAVMVDEPSAGRFFGGQVAAPVFSQIAQHALRALDVAPDRSFAPQIVAKDTAALPEHFR
jgi:cell division protein FtsI (penicillin-binding protein 3)